MLHNKYFPLVGLFIALLLPFSLLTISSSHNWWTTYVSWVAFFMQSFLMLTASWLMYRAAFHKKILGGVIGSFLRIFSVGLFLLGCGLTQIPFITAYNLWETNYVREGFYFLPYVLGGIAIAISLLVGKRNELKREGVIISGVILGGIGLRFLLSFVPLFPNTFYLTASTYQFGVTIDVVLLCLVVALILLGMVHKNIFQNSQVGKMFQLQVFGFSWYLIPIISDFLGDMIPGWSFWYTYTLGGILLFGGSLLLGAIYFYKMAVFVYEIQLS